MANIVINEVSQNYSYNIGSASYACIAMPITASWGPYLDLSSKEDDDSIDDILERTQWQRFAATQAGLESFVSTYRGASSCYRLAKDFSYQMAITLMSAGYDILVCRIAPGSKANALAVIGKKQYSITAKYPGTFGNNLQVVIKKYSNNKYINLITYVVDSSGIRTAVENITCALEEKDATETILYMDEVESNFIDITYAMVDANEDTSQTTSVNLEGGSDLPASEGAPDTTALMKKAQEFAKARYTLAGYKLTDDVSTQPEYLKCIQGMIGKLSEESSGKVLDSLSAQIIMYREQIYRDTMYALDILKDKLSYNCNRIFLSGWDDQDILFLTGEHIKRLENLSPFHIKLLDVAYNSRCATGMIDIPRSLARSGVYNESEDTALEGYAQKLARYLPADADVLGINGSLYASHCALFAPWGQYRYVSSSRMQIAPPSFLAMMIQRSMILNQSIQYEWALPVSRQHSLNIGKMDYRVPKKLLDEWQKLEGVGVNVITNIPDIGTSLWGNSTLFEVPVATYQALANLSTRYLVNAIENLIWKCGVAITFRYNNLESYNSFYAGVTPLLDTMKNVGAIEDYYVKMSADINGYDQVNANSVVGQVVIIVNGVVNNISVDLIALPQGVSLDNYQ